MGISETEDKPIAPVICPTCEQWTPRYQETCLWCLTQVDPDSAEQTPTADIGYSEEATQARDDVVQMVTGGELSEDDIETMRDVERAIREYPDLLDLVDQLMEGARDD